MCPAMRNPIPVKTILERIYVEGADIDKGVPDDGVPTLLKHAVPLQDVVKVDLHVPGCPPPARVDCCSSSGNCWMAESPT